MYRNTLTPATIPLRRAPMPGAHGQLLIDIENLFLDVRPGVQASLAATLPAFRLLDEFALRRCIDSVIGTDRPAA